MDQAVAQPPPQPEVPPCPFPSMPEVEYERAAGDQAATRSPPIPDTLPPARSVYTYPASPIYNSALSLSLAYISLTASSPSPSPPTCSTCPVSLLPLLPTAYSPLSRTPENVRTYDTEGEKPKPRPEPVILT